MASPLAILGRPTFLSLGGIGCVLLKVRYTANLYRRLQPAHKTLNLIYLQPSAGEVPHLGIHSKTHDRIAVDSGNSFNGTEAGTFCQCSDCRDFLVDVEYVWNDFPTVTVLQ
jgi:hypothetical protein